MADVKISELPAASTPLAGTEQIPLVQDATTKQITVSNLLTSANLGTPSAINLANATNVPMDEASGVLAVANGGSGTATPALVAGTNVTISGSWPNQTINSTYSGAVTSVTGTAPVVSSGGTTPAISMAAATGSVNGYLTSTDWTTFNNKLTSGGPLGTPSSGTATNLTGLPLSTGVTGLLPVANGGTGTATPNLVAGSNVTISGTWPNQTIAAAGAAQVYPGAGIANSTGSAWGTSYSTTGSGTVVALATSPTFVTPALGVPASGDFSSGTFTWPTFNQNTTGTAAGLSATLAVASGGTGQTSYTDGQLLIGNSTGNTLTKATLTAGANITITNSAGGITIAAAGGGGSGTVTSVSGTGTVNGLTLTGTVTTSGDLTLGGTLSGIANSALTNSSITIGGTAIALGASSNALANDITIYGITVGRGAGAVATNTAVGASALAANTTGAFNVAIGRLAATANTTGQQNIAIGNAALYVNTTGSYMVGVGEEALAANTTGADNSAYGSYSLFSNTTASYNTAVGSRALYSNTTASNNTAVGYQAAYSNTTGTDVCAFGNIAAYSNTTGTYLNAFGRAALYSNTTGANNAAFGHAALYSNTTGGYNTAFGSPESGGIAVLRYNTTGTYNTAVGSGALGNNTTASNNTAVGYQAGYSSNGGNNVFHGYKAGYANATGGQSVMIGANAGLAHTDSDYNVFIGYNSGSAITTGDNNTIIGSFTGNQGGLDIRTSSNYIVLSDGAGNPRVYVNNGGTIFSGVGGDLASSTNNYIFNSPYYSSTSAVPNVIGNWAAGGQWGIGSHTNAANSYVRIGIVSANAWTASYPSLYSGAYTNASDYRIKENVQNYPDGALTQVLALRPVTYKVKDTTATNMNGSVETIVGESTIGFIAHEVQDVIPKIVSGTKDEVDQDGTAIHQGLDYSKMVTVLVKAIQEQQAIIESLKARLDAANL